jgi:hypothetical protein
VANAPAFGGTPDQNCRAGRTVGNVENDPYRPPQVNPALMRAARMTLTDFSASSAVAALAGFGRLTYFASLPAPVLSDLADSCRTGAF